MRKWLKRTAIGLILSLGALGVITLSVPAIRSQIMSTAGLAVAQTTTKWNHLKDAAQGDNLTDGLAAIGLYGFDGTNWDRIHVNASGAIQAEVSGTVTPADNYANPTTALQSYSLTGLWDGATWDRALASTHADALATAAGQNVAAVSYGYNGATYDRLRTGVSTGVLLVDKSSNAATNIVANASTVVKASPGRVNMITVNVVGAGSTAALYNDATAPCDTNYIGTIDTTALREIELDHTFSVGICVLTAGAGAADISVLYR